MQYSGDYCMERPQYFRQQYKNGYHQQRGSPICYLDRDARFTRFLSTSNLGVHRQNNNFKKIGAGGIIINPEGELLIVKGSTKWSLPKGHLEPGEKYHECAMREIQEEANLKVHLSVTDRYIDVKKCVYFIIVLSETERLNLKTNDPDEISEVKWAKIEEISKLDCNRQLDYVINRWNYIQSIIENSGKRLVRYPVQMEDSDEIDYCSDNVCFVPDFKKTGMPSCESASVSSCDSTGVDISFEEIIRHG